MVKKGLLTLSKENKVLYLFLAALLNFSVFNGINAQQMVCNDQVNVSLNINCEAAITADMVLEGDPEFYGGPFTIQVSTPHVYNNNTSLPVVTKPGSYRVTIFNSTGNRCWGNLLVEDKLAPQVDCACPAGNTDPSCAFLCTDEVAFRAGTLDYPKPIVVENCGPYTTLISDQIITQGLPCGAKIIRRSWVFTDEYGNVSQTCVSDYRFNPVNLGNHLAVPYNNIKVGCGADLSHSGIYNFFFAKLKPQFKAEFLAAPYYYSQEEAEAAAVKKATLEANKHAYPTVNGFPVNGAVCNILATSADTEILPCGDDCPKSKKVVRTWTIVDWCNGITITYPQLIDAKDDVAPVIEVEDITLSVDPWVCAGNFLLPSPELTDNCDSNPTYTVSGPAGVSIVWDAPSKRFLVTGAPKGEHTFTYTAKDCCGNISEEDIYVTLLDHVAPVAVAKQNIVISLTKEADGTGTAKLFTNSVNNGSYDNCTDIHLEIRRERNGAADTGCGYTGNFTYNNDGHPEDGSTNPASANYDPDNGAYVKFCCSDLTNVENGVPYGIVKVWMRVWDDANMSGKFGDVVDGHADNFNETWVNVRVEDKLAPRITCPDNKTITCDLNYKDLNLTGTATAVGTCSALETEFTDTEFLNTCKSGYVIRNWRVKSNPAVKCTQRIDIIPATPFSGQIIWPADFTTDCTDLSEPKQPTWASGPCDQIGVSLKSDTFYFEQGACLKILNHWTLINWCTYNPNSGSNNGIYSHTQVIKVIDNQKPVLDNCVDKIFEINDHFDADQDGNVCETKNLTLTMAAVDQGQCASSWLKWTIYVDLWADGVNDYEYSSFLPANDGTFNDSNGNGIKDKYVAATNQGELVSVTIPEDIAGNMSSHKVYWRVTDGCGNSSNCTQNFMVVDKKKPTPYCLNISSALMSNGTVELWAVDFNLGSFDNCTSKDNLLYTFDEANPVLSKLNQVHYFKGAGIESTLAEYLAGNAQKWLPASKSSGMVFNCTDYPTTQVRMTVWDQKLNYDFCVVTLNLADNQGVCGGSRPTANVSGTIKTNYGKNLGNATAVISNDFPEMLKSTTTSATGQYELKDNFVHYNYTLQAEKNDDYMNGVSTLDLVLMQRHVLGINPLLSPYDVIASDINKDNKINATDLVELRKLILGVYNELPNNGSWRFVDSKQTFTDVNNPWPVNEAIQITDLSHDMTNQNFVAVKVGDLNGSATGFAGDLETESRSVAYLNAENVMLKAGETTKIVLNAEDVNDVFGLQFTLNVKDASLVDIFVGQERLSDDHIAAISNQMFTVSWNGLQSLSGTELITLVVKADKNIFAADAIALHSGVTAAEMYTSEMLNTQKLNLRFNGAETDNQFAVFQNEPNPFQDKTYVQYILPESGIATLSVYDVTGKLLYTASQQAEKGINTFPISRSELSSHGVMIYTIESGSYSASKKMIGLE